MVPMLRLQASHGGRMNCEALFGAGIALIGAIGILLTLKISER